MIAPPDVSELGAADLQILGLAFRMQIVSM
jgi:hypothetical protein